MIITIIIIIIIIIMICNFRPHTPLWRMDVGSVEHRFVRSL